MLGPLYSLGRILATAGFVSSILMSILMVIPGPFQIYERTAVSRRRTLSSILYETRTVRAEKDMPSSSSSSIHS